MRSLSITKFPALDYACEEAVNTLCTNLSFAGKDIKKILFTSSHAGEGKSYLAVNVMRTLAKLGKTVVLVDADLRKSLLKHRYGLKFDKKPEYGLAHYLAGIASAAEVLYKTDIPNAYIIPAGTTVSNSLTLLSGDMLKELLDQLTKTADYVIVDAPPVGLIIDAAEIAKVCDGVVVAVGYNTVHRKELQDVENQLKQTGCPILGAVLNQVEMDKYLNKRYYYRDRYYGGYGSYYGSSSAAKTDDLKIEKTAKSKKSKKDNTIPSDTGETKSKLVKNDVKTDVQADKSENND